MLKSNCHTHTVFCDGKNTPEEMIHSAVKLGFHDIGFSVHSPMTVESTWACREEDLEKYIKTIKYLKEKYSGIITVTNGIELDADHTEIDLSDFDYIIGAMHQLRVNNDYYPIDESGEILADTVDKVFGGSWLAMAKHYYSDYADYIIKLRPDVIAHFDLIQKFNKGNRQFDSSSDEYRLFVKLYLEKILYNCPECIFEVNTGAMFRCGNDIPYPDPFIMKQLKKHNARITISSDSHSINTIDYKFNEMIEYCRGFGFSTVYALNNGVFEPQNI